MLEQNDAEALLLLHDVDSIVTLFKLSTEDACIYSHPPRHSSLEKGLEGLMKYYCEHYFCISKCQVIQNMIGTYLVYLLL